MTRNLIHFISLLIILCPVTLKAQNNSVSTIPIFYEKVYLHTDRETYTPGEDVWFKAYLVNAQNNQPVNYSHNLYVELFRPGSKVMLRRVIRLENGLGNGDFKLPDKLDAGTYTIRAYTNWMRNFGDNFVFEKRVRIITDPGNGNLNASTTAESKPKPVSKNIVKADKFTAADGVRFFPEGGSLVNNVRSIVAVKAEDEAGKGFPASGEVIASSGRTVAKFTCDSLGMGTFTLRPDETQAYHADVKINGTTQSFKLVKVLHKGFVLSVSTTDDIIATEISCNGFQLNDYAGGYVIVEARHGNKVYYKQRVPVVSASMLVQIPHQNFPEGVAHITLYDDYGKPLNERLTYVHHTNNATLALSTNKTIYQPREQVTLKLKLSDTSRANLSLAVVDEALAPVGDNDIVSYLTLKSELKGTIERPNRYFEPNNPDRLKQLDLLLLTQGWRDFLWKNVVAKPFERKFELGQDMTIHGTVKAVVTNKVMPGMNITMFLPKGAKNKMFTAKTDSAGNFLIDGAILYGYSYGLFTSRNDKGKARGWVRVDSLWQDTILVSRLLQHENLITDKDTISRIFLERSEQKKKFDFAKNNQLNQVDIKTKTKAIPPKVYNISKKDYGPDDDFRYLFSFLRRQIPHSALGYDKDTKVTTLVIHHGSLPGYGPIQDEIEIQCSYINDTTKVIISDIFNVVMNDVAQITITYPTALRGLPKVYIVLRPGALDKVREFNTAWADLKGYDEARIFYTPKADSTDKDPDYRTTIHWEPNITTDKNGEACINFYNADPKTKIRIIAEGVTDKGLPISSVMHYTMQ